MLSKEEERVSGASYQQGPLAREWPISRNFTASAIVDLHRFLLNFEARFALWPLACLKETLVPSLP